MQRRPHPEKAEEFGVSLQYTGRIMVMIDKAIQILIDTGTLCNS